MTDTITLDGHTGVVTPHQLETPRKTWFYERPNGSVVAVQADEAWAIHNNRSRAYTGFKQVGCSDGTKYFQAVMDSRDLLRSQGLAAAQERLRRGFDEELEAARGKYEVPPDTDVKWPGGNPHNVRIK